MTSDIDVENIAKASQRSSLLVEDLGALASSNNPLLAELSVDMLKTAVDLEQRLRRIALLIQSS